VTTDRIALGCSLLVLSLPGTNKPHTEQQLTPSDSYWRLGKKYWLIWLVIPIVILLIAYLTVASHDEPLPGSHLRFVTPEKTSEEPLR
jgi:hypothetical protein